VTRVGYVLATSTGGTLTHVAMLARGCAARGMRVRVFGPAEAGDRFPGGRPVPGTVREDGRLDFETVEIPGRLSPGRGLAAVLRLRRLLRSAPLDLVHAHGLRAGAVAALAAPRRCPLAVTLHNMPPAGAVPALLERLVARRAAAVTWVSPDLAARIRRLGGRDGGRAVVAAPPPPPLADRALAQARADLAAGDRPVVLAVGRLAPQKGFSVLLAAAAVWQRCPPAPVLAIAGEGPLAAELAAQARSQQVAVRFLGHRADVPALLAAANVVVVPSVWEGQPLVVQEALRAGRPLVASRAGGIADLTGEDGALLVPAGNPQAIADAVLAVLTAPGLASRLAAGAARRAAALPTVAEAVDAAANLYQRLLAVPGKER
jgi:glycosyltransferase involved in cell wall biosynthesis